MITLLAACGQSPRKPERNIYRQPTTQQTKNIAAKAPITVDRIIAAQGQKPPPGAQTIPGATEKVAGMAPQPATPATPRMPTAEPDTKTLEQKAETSKMELAKIDPAVAKPELDRMCGRIAARLASVSFNDCVKLKLTRSDIRSIEGMSLIYKRYLPRPNKIPLGRVLILGGTHGDELTSVSIVFKWMQTLDIHHSGLFEFLVAPLINPDGVLRKPAVRTNANGVDLNRNFPTPGWIKLSRSYWANTGKDLRRFPGNHPNSEPETQWVVNLIEDFNPDVILSVHAPLNLVDFDAIDRSISPLKLGMLKRNLKGTFPGSLGNYAGIQRGIPVVTLELPHSGSMPNRRNISSIWVDTVGWLKQNMYQAQAQRIQLKSFVAKNIQ